MIHLRKLRQLPHLQFAKSLEVTSAVPGPFLKLFFNKNQSVGFTRYLSSSHSPTYSHSAVSEITGNRWTGYDFSAVTTATAYVFSQYRRLATVPAAMPSVTTKKRIKRKGGTLQQVAEDTDVESETRRTYPVVAYATCEEINLEKLRRGLSSQGLYIPTVWPNDCDAALHDVIHVVAKYPTSEEPREIFFFREGTAVFWNVPELERNNVLNFLSEFQEESYEKTEVLQESEYMLYTHSSNEQQRQTKLVRGQIQVTPTSDNLTLEKYTVANSMALSVKLGILESTLDKFVDSIDHITEELKAGTKVKATRAEVLRKTGELFSLRNELNLNSDLLDTPDFYWEHEDLENLYHKMCNYLSIGRRTGVMNEKLAQCCELLELITGYLNDRHHVRLEWMIIALITVEVILGLSHFVK